MIPRVASVVRLGRVPVLHANEADFARDVAEACAVAREPDVAPLFRVLVQRCAAARTLTGAYLDLVENRP